MKKFKKLLSCLAAATLAATSLVGGASFSANAADGDLITDGGPYTGDGKTIATYFRSDYYQQSAFELQFKYDTVGTPSAPQPNEPDVGYNDTFEFLVFDTSWGGWNRTTVGPAGYDATSSMVPVAGEIYTVEVPISVIEGKLSTGLSPYGINIQTGAQLGTSSVSIVSLKYVAGGGYTQQPFEITGSWKKGTASTMTVSPSGAATAYAGAEYIEVSAIDLSKWTNPTIDVTVTYDSESVDDKGNFAQAEILLPTGEDGDYEAVDPNYVDLAAGTYTFTTEVPITTTEFIAAYDLCTVTKIDVYDNTAGNVTTSVAGKTAEEIKNNMGRAWSLGNALESVDSTGNVNEKAINPKTTKKLIQAVKAAGFNTLKIPISLLNLIQNDNTINDAYIARLQQVVKYAYDMGMYVVINLQADGRSTIPGHWINIDATGAEFDQIEAKFGAVWADLAANFAYYDQRLIFQAANELMNEAADYNAAPTQTEYNNINALNQAFVNNVRNAGGNNGDRVLAVVGYNNNIDWTVAGFKAPTDPTADRLMLCVNYYDPTDFALEYTDVNTWDKDGDYGTDYMNDQFAKIVGVGLPVFIGEYGAVFKNNIPTVAEYDYYVNYYAALNGIAAAYWDNGVTGYDGSALFDRINNTLTTDGKTIVAQIVAGYDAGK